MAPSTQTPALNIFQRERDERAAALLRLGDTMPPKLAADIAGDTFSQFRRGVLHRPDMKAAVVFNNNPSRFRAAEWAEMKKLLAAAGYTFAAEGASGGEDAGYTLVLFVRRPYGATAARSDLNVIADLMADALRNIGEAEQLEYHEIRIED